MADNDQERTERATEKHLKDAREKGDVPRSRDLSAALIVVAGVGVELAMRPWLGAQFRDLMQVGLSYGRDQAMNTEALGTAMRAAGIDASKVLGPLLGAAMLATLLAPVLSGGFNFSTQALLPKPERLNPIEGMKRVISLRGLVELAKSLLKVILIGGVLAMVLWNARGQLLGTGHGDVFNGIDSTLDVVSHACLLFAGALAVVGFVDMLWQRFDYARRMRMTRQEQRDEHKETEGSPEIRGRVRSMQQQMAQRRMMDAVPKADVVVLNPTHFAVALRYEEGMRAPRVVAKGLDLVAQRIRAVAGHHDVPLVTSPRLARALFHTTRIGQEVPASLYVAVAQILAYVYRVRDAAAQAQASDMPPPNPDIDSDLLGPYQLPDEAP